MNLVRLGIVIALPLALAAVVSFGLPSEFSLSGKEIDGGLPGVAPDASVHTRELTAFSGPVSDYRVSPYARREPAPRFQYARLPITSGNPYLDAESNVEFVPAVSRPDVARLRPVKRDDGLDYQTAARRRSGRMIYGVRVRRVEAPGTSSGRGVSRSTLAGSSSTGRETSTRSGSTLAPRTAGGAPRAEAATSAGAQGTPAPTPQVQPPGAGEFTFAPTGDGRTEISRTGEHVATASSDGTASVVYFDGADSLVHWNELMGDLFLFTSVPDLAGIYVGEGFQLAEPPPTSLLRAAGLKTADVLTMINGSPVSAFTEENLPFDALNGQVQVKFLRDGVESTVFLVRVVEVMLPEEPHTEGALEE